MTSKENMVAIRIAFRKYVPKVDLHYVKSSWMKQLRYCTQNGRKMSEPKFKALSLLGDQIVARCQPIMCCNPEEPSLLHGYVLGEETEDGKILHMIYVPKKKRGLGIGTQLMKMEFPKYKKEKIFCTCGTDQHFHRFLKKKWNLELRWDLLK